MKTRHPDREIFPIEIFAGTNIQASLLKSMLDDAKIYSFVKNEYVGTLAPWYTDSGGVGPVSVMVASADADEARLIVENFVKNSKSKEVH
ncbi:DUF2007 domain-containing protein [Mangrovibacterium marinum]|uniref:Putative signal transducing protein n=1 Tax=Mangrovibacterium marinum TaxID=1639118 RepID=A0A2T5C6U7_9BACT|nr:DUF2007 domain-containing protein [Mangrovibacterium marinum]PTN10646.1 putative signal transducing protein [Mangrovibacterium marinum]